MRARGRARPSRAFRGLPVGGLVGRETVAPAAAVAAAAVAAVAAVARRPRPQFLPSRRSQLASGTTTEEAVQFFHFCAFCACCALCCARIV